MGNEHLRLVNTLHYIIHTVNIKECNFCKSCFYCHFRLHLDVEHESGSERVDLLNHW